MLALVDFPFRVALVAFPALLFLSWVAAARRRRTAAEESGHAGADAWRALLTLLLALALVGQAVRWRDRAGGSRLLGSVEG